MNTQPGDEAFWQKIQENKRILFKICNAYCSNKSDREDLAQEMIYQLWKSGKNFKDEHKFSTWMYRVALNTAISFYRKERNTFATVPLGESFTNLYENNEDDSKTEEKLTLLQQFISELKELDRALMILYLEAKPHVEIAEILGISETNVATKISRIKDLLKQKFETVKQSFL